MKKTKKPVPETRTKEPDQAPPLRDGAVFKKRATLTLWAGLAAASALFNLCLYGWAQLSLGPADAPTPTEWDQLGLHLVTYGLIYTSAAIALFYGARQHPTRAITPWMLLTAAAGTHLLLGIPALTQGNGLHTGGVGIALYLNPLTYIAAAPALLVARYALHTNSFVPKVTAMALTTAALFPLLVVLI